MAEERNPIKVAADLGGAFGFAGLVVAAIMWFLSLPGLIVGAVACISFGALVVGILGHVFFSNSVAVETIGEWRQGHVLPDEQRTGQRTTVLPLSPPREKADGLTLEEIERHYELKKLQSNFVSKGSEYVGAHIDEQGVIVRDDSLTGDSLHALVECFGNEQPRNKVRAERGVAFRLNFIIYEGSGPTHFVNIDRGAWLNEAATEIDFPSHCPRRRAIVAIVDSERRVYTISRDSDSSYKGILPLREELTGDLYSVYLALLVDSRHARGFDFMLEIIRGEEIELKLTPADLWKSQHLYDFVREAHVLSLKLHQIWKSVNDQFPLPEPTPDEGIFRNPMLPQKDTSELVDIADVLKRIREAEREGEQGLLDGIKGWEARAVAFIGKFVGNKERDKFAKCVPSVDDAFNRVRRSFADRIQLASPDGKASPPSSPNWSLADAVNRRVDMLMNMANNAK